MSLSLQLIEMRDEFRARFDIVPVSYTHLVHGHDRQADADARRKAQIGIVADVQHVLRDDGAPLRRGRRCV